MLFPTDEGPEAVHHKNITSSHTFPPQMSSQPPAAIPEASPGGKGKEENPEKQTKSTNKASDILLCGYNQLITILLLLWRIFWLWMRIDWLHIKIYKCGVQYQSNECMNVIYKISINVL